MLHRVRELMRPHLSLRRRHPRWFSEDESITMQEKVMIVCLMFYYLQPEEDIFSLIDRLFEQNIDKVNPEMIARQKELINDDSQWGGRKYRERTVIAMKGDFFYAAEKLIDPLKLEGDIEVIALKLYQEYFVGHIPA